MKKTFHLIKEFKYFNQDIVHKKKLQFIHSRIYEKVVKLSLRQSRSDETKSVSIIALQCI
jgi:hypothetical protein